MGTCSRLATWLDAEMLARHRISIYPPGTSDKALMVWHRWQVAWQLGGRSLLRYLLPWQAGLFEPKTRDKAKWDKFVEQAHYVTPTPFSPEEAIAWLALPAPDQPRPYVVLLDPLKIADSISILGPRRVRMGGGIEYVLSTFPKDAVVNVGVAPADQWPLLVT